MLIPTKNDLIYLASLYSLETKDKFDIIREIRYNRVMEATAALTAQGYVVFSPILHCHKMSLKYNLPGEWLFWEHIDSIFLSKSDWLVILLDEGWEKSVGISAEIKIAKLLNKPICFVDCLSSVNFEFKSYV